MKGLTLYTYISAAARRISRDDSMSYLTLWTMETDTPSWVWDRYARRLGVPN
jgi:hypothetical protein